MSATIHQRSPCHFVGISVACNVPFAHSLSGPFSVWTTPGAAGARDALPPFEGRPLGLDRQNAILAPASRSAVSRARCASGHFVANPEMVSDQYSP